MSFIRLGVAQGVACVACCGHLMILTCVPDLMAPAAMAMLTAAITAERVGVHEIVVSRAVGVLLIAAGCAVLAARLP